MAGLKGINDTAELIQARKIYQPIKENVQIYRELYDIFERLYWKLQPEFADIAAYQKNI